jgi:hypothetical protein
VSGHENGVGAVRSGHWEGSRATGTIENLKKTMKVKYCAPFAANDYKALPSTKKYLNKKQPGRDDRSERVGSGRVIEKRGAGGTALNMCGQYSLGKKQGRGAAIGLGNDPEIALVRIGPIDRMGREKARTLFEGEVVFCGVIGGNNAPVALNVAKKTFPQILGCASIESGGSADDTQTWQCPESR